MGRISDWRKERARAGAEILTASLSSVTMAAAVTVHDDAAWKRFSDFSDEMGTGSFVQREREVMDESIARVDQLRQEICREFGMDPGPDYEKRFK